MYVRLAGKLWHQIVGIPIKTHYAAFWRTSTAHAVCFTYEFDVFETGVVVDERNWILTREMLKSERYIPLTGPHNYKW